MLSRAFPDWNRIGRKVGKKLRDVLSPPTDTGPSREERRAQRLLDVFKGFAYLDDFDELAAWKKADVDPIQCLAQLMPPSGGYHDYEAVRPFSSKRKMYFCNYLQYVEIFVYFSHKLVCCPPPTWTNTLHRNGVKVLGTFIVEPQTLGVEHSLDEENNEYLVARQLADMAETYGFDGWLLNFEGEFPTSINDPVGKILAFIRNLKHLLGPEGKVIWYDALTVNNQVNYQNGLTLQNVEFALAADALFTNYEWTKTQLTNARITAQWHGLDAVKIYFGIDVWAQNTNMSGPKRVTYPEDGGGGTLTGLIQGDDCPQAVETLAEHGLSAAIFGPAWTHEHFPDTHINKYIAALVDKAMWEGSALPDELYCDCKIGRPHHRIGFHSSPIVKGAREYPAGSYCFVESDFQGPFRQIGDQGPYGELLYGSDLGFVKRLPRSPSFPINDIIDPNLQWELRISDSHSPGDDESCLQLYLKATVPSAPGPCSLSYSDHSHRLCLFNLDMPADNTLTARIMCQRAQATKRIRNAGLYAAYRVSSSGELTYADITVPVAKEKRDYDIPIRMPPSERDPDGRETGRLVEFGVFCGDSIEDYSMSKLEILRIYSLIIRPLAEPSLAATITNARILTRQSGSNCEKRLAWDWIYPREHWPAGRPWSKVTGPFARFDIVLDDRILGQVCCPEFPLRREDFGGDPGSDKVEVIIQGTFFGGGTVNNKALILKATLEMAEES
ncbi:MAG: hypothetical protein Q9163_002019 [Psora crenata]